MKTLRLLIIGFVFGVVMYKSQAVSWYRIFEMFRFQSFHMFGIIGTAVASGLIITRWIKIKSLKTVSGEPVPLKEKALLPKANLIGGVVFGLGWALSGACPGPMFVLVGSGYVSLLIVIFGGLLGTLLYGLLKKKLPH